MKYQEMQNLHTALLVDDDGFTVCDIRTPNPNAGEVARDFVDMRNTLESAIKVIEDFLPNIGKCVLQDYGRLNDVLVESSSLLRKYP